MLARCPLLVTFYLISLARYNDGAIEESVSAINTGQVRMKALDKGHMAKFKKFFQKSFEKKSLIPTNSIARSTGGKLPSDDKVVRQWKIDEDKSKPLAQDSRELTTLFKQIGEDKSKQLAQGLRKLFKKTLKKRKKYWGFYVEEDVVMPLGIMELVALVRETLVFFKNHMLRELRGIESNPSPRDIFPWVLTSEEDPSSQPIKLSSDLVNLITDKARRKTVGDVFIHEWKELIIRHDDAIRKFMVNSRKPSDGIKWWIYVLTAIDFLLKYDFVSQVGVREFFRCWQMHEYLKWYAEINWFQDEKEKFQFLGSYHLTEHWRWRLSHESFEALSNRMQHYVNASFMQERFLLEPNFLAVLRSLNLNPIWVNFFDGLKVPPETFEQGKKDVEMMITLIATPDNRFLDPREWSLRRPMEYLWDYLNWMEDAWTDVDLLAEKIPNHPDREEFDNRFKLIKFSANINYFNRNADEFYEHIQKSNPSDWFKSRRYKSIFDDYLKKSNDFFKKYRAEFVRVKRKPEHAPDPDFQSKVEDVISHFQKSLNELNQKSNSFSVPV